MAVRRTMGVVAVAAVVLVGATACGGGSDSATTTTAASSGSSTTAAVTKYCDKVDELATLVAKGRSGATDYDAQVRAASEELKTLSNDAAKSLATKPAAAKKFGECSLAASKKIAESLQPG